MQVSHAELTDTHAVIGGAAPQAFGMAETAEFYTVLSDTLYQHKKLAAVREPICNGWDAHIKAGCTDRPLEITLTDDEVIFQDFGPGIPHDMVRTVYCVYGGSTKTLDNNQTGGFGLGSKAPFAYSDHFTVTVCHGGLKIIYAISRGGIETGGKPDIRAMVTVPTQETGVTVNIPLKSAEDSNTFRNNIIQVVKEGGILARLNGEKLRRIDYATARKTGYIMLSTQEISRTGSIFALSGTVLYPVSTNPDESSKTIFETNSKVPYGYKLVLIDDLNAPGIAPVPSREALSYSEITKATLNKLAKRFLSDLRQHLPRANVEIWDKCVKKAENLTNIGGIHNAPYGAKDTAWLCAIAIAHSAAIYPSKITDNDAPNLIAALRRKFPKMRSRLRRLEGIAKSKDKSTAPAWANTSYLNSALHRVQFDHDLLPLMRVVNDSAAHKFLRFFEASYSNQTYVAKFAGLAHRPVWKRIILAQNRAEATLEMQRLTKDTYGKNTFVCLFIPRRNEELREQVIAAAEQRQIPLSVTKPVPAKPRKEKVETPKKTYHSFGQFMHHSSPDVTDPSCYILVGGSHNDAALSVSSLPIEFLKERYGDVVVVRRAQMGAVKAAGIPALKDLIGKELIKADNSRALLVGILVQRGLIINGYEENWTIKNLLAKHPKVFFEFTSYKGVKRDRAMFYSQLFAAFERMVSLDPTTDIDQPNEKLITGWTAAAKKLALEEGPTRGAHYEATDGIGAISPNNINTTALPLVINFIRALKRANLENKA